MYEVPNGLWTKWPLSQETVEVDSQMISYKIPVTSVSESRAPEGRNKKICYIQIVLWGNESII